MAIVYFLRMSNSGFIYSSTEYQVTACVINISSQHWWCLWGPIQPYCIFTLFLDKSRCKIRLYLVCSFYCFSAVILLYLSNYTSTLSWILQGICLVIYNVSDAFTLTLVSILIGHTGAPTRACLLSTLKISLANFNTARKNLHEDLDWCIHFRCKWVHIFF